MKMLFVLIPPQPSTERHQLVTKSNKPDAYVNVCNITYGRDVNLFS